MSSLAAASDVIPVIFGAIVPEARAIMSASAGTVNIITATGETRTGVPLLAGMTPIRIAQVNSGGTIAVGDLWLVY